MTHGSDPYHPPEALRLLEDVRSGSVASWHRFIDIATPVIHRVLSRYLSMRDPEERRDLYVSVLDSLYRGDLWRYDGRTRLTTWLFIYVRSRCLDHLRHVRGRRALPDWVRKLSATDQEVYKLYYLQGMGGREICDRLSAAAGTPVTMEMLAGSLQRLERYVDGGVRKRTAYELQARSIGIVSGKLLEYVHRLKIENELAAEERSPDAAILKRDLQNVLEMVIRYIDRLPEIERKVIHMRYFDRSTARVTADRLGLPGQRRVYTLENRALRRLREFFER